MSQNFAVFSWREEAIAKRHDRKGFDCGVATLNEYLRHFARQNHQSGGAKTFVAVTPNDAACVLGYYSISPGAVEFASVPERLTKKLERFEVPVFRLARLAVAVSAQREGFRRRIVAGGWRASFVRCERSRWGGSGNRCGGFESGALVFRFGALSLKDDPLKLIWPLATIAAAIHQAGEQRR